MALFDQSAKTYDDWCSTPLGSFVDETEKKIMLEVTNPNPGETVLDIGCGTGIYSLLLSQQGTEVTGIDISTAMLNKAKEKANQYNRPITFIEGDIQHLPFADDTFDLVISNIVLEFVDHPQDVISEAMRVLHPGARLVIGMIGKHSEWAAMYEKQGNEKQDSVFSGARFYRLQDIEKLYTDIPSEIRLGLYVTRDEFVTYEHAALLEKQRSISQQEEGAGFIVAKWVKK